MQTTEKNNRRMKADFKCPLWGGKQVLVQSKFAHTSESKAVIKHLQAMYCVYLI
jgi:hypothetical protein